MRSKKAQYLVSQGSVYAIIVFEVPGAQVIGRIKIHARIVVLKGVVVEQELAPRFGEIQPTRAGQGFEYIASIANERGAVADHLVATTCARVLRSAWASHCFATLLQRVTRRNQAAGPYGGLNEHYTLCQA
jgi:hypothetical protein